MNPKNSEQTTKTPVLKGLGEQLKLFTTITAAMAPLLLLATREEAAKIIADKGKTDVGNEIPYGARIVINQNDATYEVRGFFGGKIGSGTVSGIDGETGGTVTVTSDKND